MKENRTVIKVVYILTKKGTPYKIMVNTKKQYEEIRKKVKACKSDFVDILPTLDIRKSEIVSIEYVEETYKEGAGQNESNR